MSSEKERASFLQEHDPGRLTDPKWSYEQTKWILSLSQLYIYIIHSIYYIICYALYIIYYI